MTALTGPGGPVQRPTFRCMLTSRDISGHGFPDIVYYRAIPRLGQLESTGWQYKRDTFREPRG